MDCKCASFLTVVGVLIIAPLAFFLSQPAVPRRTALSEQTMLILMVKNEAQIISRSLSSMRGSVADWLFLCDTGSTDDTMELAREIWPANRLFIYNETAFRNFEHNRNVCRRQAEKVCPPHIRWIALADADFTAHARAEQQVQYDVNLIQIHGKPHNMLNMLINRTIYFDWCRYRLWTHEYLQCDRGTQGFYNGFYYEDHADGKSRPEKLQRDIRLLHAWLERRNETDLRSRALYYLARAYEDSGNLTDALHWYRRHNAEPNATLNYLWYAHYRIMRVALTQGTNVTEAYLERVATAAMDQWDGYYRKEPYYFLARYFRLRDNLGKAFRYALTGTFLPPVNHQRMPLFLETDIYDWAMEEEYAYLLYRKGEYRRSLYHYGNVLNASSLPASNRKDIENTVAYISKNYT